MGTVAYHSSLTDPVGVKPRRRFRLGSSVAYVSDVTAGLGKEFRACDLLYSEIAWEAHFERFARRAGSNADYQSYIQAISAIVTSTKRPCILIVGRKALKHLPVPDGTDDVNLNTGGRFIADAVAMSYRCSLPHVRERHKGWQNVDTENLLHALARTYARVGDFCCGYGNTGRIFAEEGRSWVLSDASAECIGYIAEHAAEWGHDDP